MNCLSVSDRFVEFLRKGLNRPMDLIKFLNAGHIIYRPRPHEINLLVIVTHARLKNKNNQRILVDHSLSLNIF